MADQNKILVEVLQGTQSMGGGCSCTGGCPSAATCGTPVDYTEAATKLFDDLKQAYGDKVEVKYVDVDKEGLGDYPVMNQVLQMGYPYPITLVNGAPKFAGGIMVNEIKQIIDEEIKGQAN